MILETLTTPATAKEIASHVVKWLVNLNRAGEERKLQSLRAVNKVVSLARMTRAYARGLKVGEQDFNTEANLAGQWSELAFELKQLKLHALAKKCDLKSRYWADPEQFSPDFLAEADISFDTVERLAREMSVRIESGRKIPG
ncbi:MAG: hypothetical protein QM739_08800 [Propionivibrio sp.]